MWLWNTHEILIFLITWILVFHTTYKSKRVNKMFQQRLEPGSLAYRINALPTELLKMHLSWNSSILNVGKAVSAAQHRIASTMSHKHNYFKCFYYFNQIREDILVFVQFKEEIDVITPLWTDTFWNAAERMVSTGCRCRYINRQSVGNLSGTSRSVHFFTLLKNFQG